MGDSGGDALVEEPCPLITLPLYPVSVIQYCACPPRRNGDAFVERGRQPATNPFDRSSPYGPRPPPAYSQNNRLAYPPRLLSHTHPVLVLSGVGRGYKGPVGVPIGVRSGYSPTRYPPRSEEGSHFPGYKAGL